MTFETLVSAVAERFLSDRTCKLIVEPALADLHFDHGRSRLDRAANQLAVLRALAGGLRGEAARGSGFFIVLTLMTACYNLVLFTLFADFISLSSDLFGVAMGLLVLSLGPVVACFWPERRTLPPAN